MRKPLTICGNHLQFAESAYICGFRIQILQIPLTFADSTFIFRNPLTIAESRTTSYICLLWNPQQNKCADKICVTGICTRNPRNFCKWSSFTFWNMFNDFLWNPETHIGYFSFFPPPHSNTNFMV